ncbi:MAG: HEPN domain-containing protein [Acidobacteriia bacterium]|nr:HEPN domain-containing protein [Terriglobia bacterium]
MSLAKSRYEAERWLRTAEEDLHAARVLLEAQQHAQSCFYSQQSGEKAVKALWYLIDVDPWGHSVQKLIIDFPRKNDLPDLEKWISWGALLDKFYIPTRYPNGLPDLTPGQVYTREDALHGQEAAQALIAGCRAWMDSAK